MDFYKCVFVEDREEIEGKLEVKVFPTFVIFLNGIVVGRIEKLDESKPSVGHQATASGEESEDEKKVKTKLNELCETHKEKLTNWTESLNVCFIFVQYASSQ